MKSFSRLLMLIALLCAPACLVGQDTAGASPSSPPTQPSAQEAVTQPSTPKVVNDEYEIEASETSQGPQRQIVSWNHYEGKYVTFKFGAGFLIDANAYAQDDVSKQQIKMTPDFKLRDFRFIMGGKFPRMKRLSWAF